LLQSFALMADRRHVVPTSPANFRRAWDLARRNLRACPPSEPMAQI
jgi:hypothetical protein